jgi:phosphatidylserine/phosphatidylglycerophosphate/cardiolipin synthase-like enzyme
MRLFNPFTSGRDSVVGRAFGAIGDLRRVNHRMHNKLLLADGAMAIVGGRNMADEYFQRHEEANFLDFDLLALGPVVPQLAALFDRYWNHPHAVPVQAVASSTLDVPQLRDDFTREVQAPPSRPWPTVPPRDLYGDPPLGADLDRGLPRLIWAPAQAFADTPDKIDFARRPEQFGTTVTHRTIESLREATSEIVLVSPYFIPGSAGVARLQEARQRGVAVRVVTNSMAASDEPLVSVAYHRYRIPLLRAGVQLYELSPAQLRFDPRARSNFGRSKGSLHAKLAFIDRRTVLLGSMNLDARSAWTNTELGLRVDSAQLSERIGGVPALATGRGAYQVRLADDGTALQWHALNAATDEHPLADEPEVGWWERTKLRLLSLFVAEDLL